MQICFIDESGDLGVLGNPPLPNDQPVLVIGGLFVDVADLASLTYNFLNLKRQYFPRLPYPSTKPLDRILPEAKGADVRGNARTDSPSGSRTNIDVHAAIPPGLRESAQVAHDGAQTVVDGLRVRQSRVRSRSAVPPSIRSCCCRLRRDKRNRHRWARPPMNTVAGCWTPACCPRRRMVGAFRCHPSRVRPTPGLS